MKKPIHNLEIYVGDDLFQYLLEKKIKSGILSLSTLGRYYLLIGLSKESEYKTTSEFIQKENIK